MEHRDFDLLTRVPIGECKRDCGRRGMIAVSVLEEITAKYNDLIQFP